MRRIVIAVFLAAIAVGALECASSYVLYRHYAGLKKSFHPIGSSTALLLNHLYVRFIEGRHEVVELSINHGPLFRADPTLGFAMYPGSYEIIETFDTLKHRFQLTVDKMGRRVTSYLPVDASRRIYITGDSAMFGWGLDDEQTIPWLLQARLPKYQVVNLSLTSYSTIQTLFQLNQMVPKVSADDIVLLTYHPVANELNVATPDVLRAFLGGYEVQLGDANFVNSVTVPFGVVDAQGKLGVRRVNLSCFRQAEDADCVHPKVDVHAAMEVTMRAFDEIVASCPGRVVVAFISGTDDDPVIQHLRSKGVLVIDLRTAKDAPDADDTAVTDSHGGPFWHHRFYVDLVNALRRNHLIE